MNLLNEATKPLNILVIVSPSGNPQYTCWRTMMDMIMVNVRVIVVKGLVTIFPFVIHTMTSVACVVVCAPVICISPAPHLFITYMNNNRLSTFSDLKSSWPNRDRRNLRNSVSFCACCILLSSLYM